MTCRIEKEEEMPLTRPYLDDPEPSDENDPEVKEEMFRTFQYMKIKPEELKEDQEEYAAWLAKVDGEEHHE
jgi:hypothetical protein